jgi:hypothetical protein
MPPEQPSNTPNQDTPPASPAPNPAESSAQVPPQPQPEYPPNFNAAPQSAPEPQGQPAPPPYTNMPPKSQTAAPPPGQPASSPPGVPPQSMQLQPQYGHDKLAIASLILGIVSLPASILTILTLPIPIIGIVLGFVGLKKNKGLAIAGIILSALGIIFSVLILTVGLHLLHKQSSQRLQFSSTNNAQQTAAGVALTSKCYKVTLPKPFVKADIRKSADCTSELVTATSTDDVVINSGLLNKPVSKLQTRKYLKSFGEEFEARLPKDDVTITSHKFIKLDGVPAYEGMGTEKHGNYHYVGYIVALSPKGYAVNGVKLRKFLITYDSATSKNRLDEIANSWFWQ